MSEVIQINHRDILDARAERVGFLPIACGVYVLLNLRAVEIYVGAAINVRDRIQRHLTGCRSDPVGNRFFCPSEVGYVDFYPCDSKEEAKALETHLLFTLDAKRPLFNIKIPKAYVYVEVPQAIRLSVAHESMFDAAKDPVWWTEKNTELLSELLRYRRDVKDTEGVQKAINVRRSMLNSYEREDSTQMAKMLENAKAPKSSKKKEMLNV